MPVKEELVEKVAAAVTARSQEAQLTTVDELAVELEVEPRQVEEALAALPTSQAAQVEIVRSLSGKMYLYDPQFITASYAELLVRVEERNPLQMIAATVRDESRLYPRPTTAELFTQAPFNLTLQEVEGLVAEMARREEYRDVQGLKASSGALYLFSARYLQPDYAAALVEWLEVGQYESP